jgi:PAS domain S-box-containing protein
VFRIVNEETRAPAENPAVRALREGRIVGLANHTVLLAKDGREIPIDDAASPIRDEQGRISGVVLIFRDITESRRAQHALAASEMRFRQLAETVPHMIWVADASGTMQYVNARYRAYFGWTADESICHENILSAAHTEDGEQMMQRWRASLSSGEQLECEVRLQRASDSAWRWHLVRSAGVREPESGKVSRWFGSATDIHEQRTLQMRLAEDDRRKDEFLAVLAHELRNPLAPIRNALEILRVDPNVSGLIRQAREVMLRQLQQLVRLVDDLLDVSRIRQGKIELRPARLDLTDVLNLAVEACRPLFDAGAHAFVFTPPATPIAVMGDETRLTQAIQNMLNNAAKFTARGGRIELQAEATPGSVTIRIRDEGRGIGAEELPYIFDLFAQGQKHDTAHQGLGIGLNLARRLIEMHGGRVSAASRGLGQGSEFTITLPTIAAAEATAPQKAPAPRSPRVTSWSILIVDDNADSADTLSLVLSARGHKTHVAYDGAAALEAAQRTKPDVVLLDIGMPGIDGYEVARRLREIHGLWATLIVAQTGWGQERDRDASRAVGFDHHLIKPIDPTELEELLSSGRRSL